AEAEAICRRFEQSKPLGARRLQAPIDPTAVPSSRPAIPATFRSPSGRRHRLRFFLLGALFFLSPWPTIGFPLLSGVVLIEQGFRVSDSLLYLGIAMFGPSIGVLAGSLMIDRLQRRTTLALCA